MEDREIFITVIITSYNRKKYLVNAIKSVLSCSLGKEHYEIILVKNYNDDDIDNFCNSNNIKSLQMDGSIGHFYSKAIEFSKGNVVSFLDDDDVWIGDKLSRVYEAFKNNGNLGYYHNGYAYINDAGERINYRRVVEPEKNLNKTSNFHLFGNNMKKNSLSEMFRIGADFNMSTISIRKKMLDDNAYSLLEEIYSFQDGAFFFISLASDYDILVDDTILTLYRINNDSVTYFDEANKRINELKKMKRSMLAVKGYMLKMINPKYAYLIDAVDCFIYENSIMIEIFSLTSERKLIFTYLIHLIAIRSKNANTLKSKVVAMAIVSLFSKRLSVFLYDKYRKIIRAGFAW